jgi:hypothetical protein
MITVRRINTTNQDLQLIQGNIQAAFQQLQSLPLVDGSEVKEVSIGTSPTQVAHGLGLQPSKWVLTDIQADARVWRTAWDDKFLTLQASAQVTVSLWVK